MLNRLIVDAGLRDARHGTYSAFSIPKSSFISAAKLRKLIESATKKLTFTIFVGTKLSFR